MIYQLFLFVAGMVVGFIGVLILGHFLPDGPHPDTELFAFQRDARIDVNYWPANVRHPGGFTCYDPEDSGSYDFEVFDTPQEALRQMIRIKQRREKLEETVARASADPLVHAS